MQTAMLASITANASVRVQQPFQSRRPQRALLVVRADAAVLEAPAAAAPAAAAVKTRRGVSRRFAEQLAKVPSKEVSLPPADAIRTVLSTASTKFTETLEASGNWAGPGRCWEQGPYAPVAALVADGAPARPHPSLLPPAAPPGGGVVAAADVLMPPLVHLCRSTPS